MQLYSSRCLRLSDCSIMPSTTMTSPLLLQTGEHAEGPGFKKPAVQDQTARLPMQKLDPVPGLVHEGIDITVARVTSQFVGHKPTQSRVWKLLRMSVGLL